MILNSSTCGRVTRNVHSALSFWQKQEETKETSYGGDGKGNYSLDLAIMAIFRRFYPIIYYSCFCYCFCWVFLNRSFESRSINNWTHVCTCLGVCLVGFPGTIRPLYSLLFSVLGALLRLPLNSLVPLKYYWDVLWCWAQG